MPRSRPTDLPRFVTRGFTLIELIFVMALLAIAATFVTTRMVDFFRGRALSLEAQRMLTLAHYGQSRAISDGVPVILWIDPAKMAYGLSAQAGYADGDSDARSYAIAEGLTLEGVASLGTVESETGDEKLGVGEGQSFIRFLPDGGIDEGSVSRIIIRQGEAALELVPTHNRLSYEIRPYTAS